MTAHQVQNPNQPVLQAASNLPTSNQPNSSNFHNSVPTTIQGGGGLVAPDYAGYHCKGERDPSQGRGVEGGTLPKNFLQSKPNLNEIPDLHDLSLFVCPSVSSNSDALANDRLSKRCQFPTGVREFTQPSLSCSSFPFEHVALNVQLLPFVEMAEVSSSRGLTPKHMSIDAETNLPRSAHHPEDLIIAATAVDQPSQGRLESCSVLKCKVLPRPFSNIRGMNGCISTENSLKKLVRFNHPTEFQYSNKETIPHQLEFHVSDQRRILPSNSVPYPLTRISTPQTQSVKNPTESILHSFAEKEDFLSIQRERFDPNRN